MTETTCEHCGGVEGESRAWHHTVVEPGDLELVEYEGSTWHRKCAENNREIKADSAGIKQETVRRASNRS